MSHFPRLAALATVFTVLLLSGIITVHGTSGWPDLGPSTAWATGGSPDETLNQNSPTSGSGTTVGSPASDEPLGSDGIGADIRSRAAALPRIGFEARIGARNDSGSRWMHPARLLAWFLLHRSWAMRL